MGYLYYVVYYGHYVIDLINPPKDGSAGGLSVVADLAGAVAGATGNSNVTDLAKLAEKVGDAGKAGAEAAAKAGGDAAAKAAEAKKAGEDAAKKEEPAKKEG